MKTLILSLALLFSMAINPLPQAAQADDKFGDLRFAPYEGLQLNWPMGESVQVTQDHAVPIYVGLPNKKYYILGRIHVPRPGGVTIVKRGPSDDLFPEKNRQRECAMLAKQLGGSAVLVTGNANILKAFNLTKEEIEKTAPLYEHKDKLVLVIQFESEIAGKK